MRPRLAVASAGLLALPAALLAVAPAPSAAGSAAGSARSAGSATPVLIRVAQALWRRLVKLAR